MSEYTTNIISVYLSLTEDEIQQGIHWYDNARALATEWANGDVWLGAGVIAAYSPMTPWWRNMELAESTLRTGAIRFDTLRMNAIKASRIMDGENPIKVLNGPKLTAFASAIADPNTDLITIDSHAHSIAIGRHLFTQQSKLGIRTRREIIEAYREAADLAGYGVSAFQAMTWVGWRNRHLNKAARKRG